MSNSPFPYTCELCGAEGLTDEGMRIHTLEAHVSGRPECPFCDAEVPQNQLVVHVDKVHLHYLTPERELMAFIDDQSPRNNSFDDDSKRTNSDSYYTPGSMNGWHSPDISSSYHSNGAISKNINHQNGAQDSKPSRSPKNIILTNGLKNINLCNGGVRPKTKLSRDSSSEDELEQDQKYPAYCNNSYQNHNTSYEGSPNKNKLGMASAGQGSPLRSQLALKLKSNTPKKTLPPSSPLAQCLLCEFTSRCPQKLEEHINRAHFDLTSPSVANTNANVENPTLNPTLALTSAMAWSPGPGTSTFQCPLCEKVFNSGVEAEFHVNVEHRDILSPQKSEVENAGCEEIVMIEESPVSNCPVCLKPLPLAQPELLAHIEEHFDRGPEGAAALSDTQREAQRYQEEHDFRLLRAQYGMDDNEVGYSSRAQKKLKNAVYKGELSVAGYYENTVGLRESTATGVDGGGSRTLGIIDKIATLNANTPSIVKTYLCCEVDHYASTYADRGWGCGYRNMQMLVSALLRHPQYSSRLSILHAEGNAAPSIPALQCLVERAWGRETSNMQMLVSALLRHPQYSSRLSILHAEGNAAPSIPALQCLVERAWGMGFDTQGSEQLGSKLYNTRKWIGACEVVTVLSSLRIRCQLIDFYKPSHADGSHPALFEWVLRYFENDPQGFKPPLYLQHQGHSRTIIGYERHKDGKATLLVLDPSHSPPQVNDIVRTVLCGKTATCISALRLLRRGSSALRAKQYQLAAVAGLHKDDAEFEASKVLQSVRIP